MRRIQNRRPHPKPDMDFSPAPVENLYMCLEAAAAVNRIFKTMRSTPARRRRKALPAESLRGKGPRVRRRAAGRARLSRWAWPRDIGSIMLTPIRKPNYNLTRGRYAYHLG